MARDTQQVLLPLPSGGEAQAPTSDPRSQSLPSVPTQPDQVDSTTHLASLSLNWTERQLPERVRTKHVHRLHPYLGKYIPQLVEVFLRKYFAKNMTVLDPFSGSGTTLIQANELEINGFGCDISKFNILIGNVKTRLYSISELKHEVDDMVGELNNRFGKNLGLFPIKSSSIEVETANSYLKEWFAPQALRELLTFRQLISRYKYQDFFRLVLSRAARSARLTTHFNLDFPKHPTTEPYECYKHSRICSPTTSALKFLVRYSYDGFNRVAEFAKHRTDASIEFLHGDSRIAKFPPADGVITSPPYVGLIDYHEQHRYAFELLNLEDNRQTEIGPAAKGQSIAAKERYIEDISAVFRNVAKSVRFGGKLIVVAGDKFELYPRILKMPGLVHDTTIQRHVNRRTGRRSTEFFESVFVYTKC